MKSRTDCLSSLRDHPFYSRVLRSVNKLEMETIVNYLLFADATNISKDEFVTRMNHWSLQKHQEKEFDSKRLALICEILTVCNSMSIL